MVKEKEGKEKNNKKAPVKSLKEKRAAKVAKRAERRWCHCDLFSGQNGRNYKNCDDRCLVIRNGYNHKKQIEIEQVVYAKVASTLKLVIRRYVDRIYYCIVQDKNVHKELVYFEWELMDGLEKTV